MSAAVLASESDPRAAAQALAHSLAQEAEQAYVLDRPGPALALAERAAALARQCGDLPVLGWALMLAGRLHMYLGHHLQAFAASREAYDLLAAGGDMAHRLGALHICGGVFWASGDTDQAIQVLRSGLAATVGRPDLSGSRFTLLLSLALLLSQEAKEYAESIECCAEAASLVTPSPRPTDKWIYATATLAFHHFKRAEQLADQGFHDKAREQREAAARALPPMDLRSWRTFSTREHRALHFQVMVLAGLGQWPLARQAAAVMLWSLRGPGLLHVVRADQLESLAAFYRHAGRIHRAVHYESQLLEALTAAKHDPESGHCLRRLADLHAQTGDHALALECRKQLAALQDRQRLEAGELRGRIAAIERQAERRRREADEELAHSQRLAVIGRLIAQTHHALSAPSEHAHCLTAQAMALAGQSASAPLIPLVEELNQTVDRAAGLVSQLKLFSYRSAPQPMALSLREALLNACRGLAPHLGSRVVELDMADGAELQAWGDAQRLGIMLKVLLIELAERANADAAATTIRARVEPGEGATVVLHIETHSAASGVPMRQETPPTVGAALCMEIAGEMGGSLQTVRSDHALLHFRLQLPDTSAHTLALPTIAELR
jgi:tetratricopeptide (TPR) repeat protein